MSEWSKEQNKAFENALAIYPENDSDRWFKIAADVPGKTLEEIKHHYQLLVYDVTLIESGCVPIPSYKSFSKGDDQEPRKGIAWTEDEHKLFLLGLEKYGRGDWRSISRNFVVTRTPTQIASHAQKYFLRLNSKNKDRRRRSIYDVTIVNNGDISADSSGQSAKQAPPIPTEASGSGVRMNGAPTIGGPLVSAVGTPVMRAPVPQVMWQHQQSNAIRSATNPISAGVNELEAAVHMVKYEYEENNSLQPWLARRDQ